MDIKLRSGLMDKIKIRLDGYKIKVRLDGYKQHKA
jgi:hypothetical protein